MENTAKMFRKHPIERQMSSTEAERMEEMGQFLKHLDPDTRKIPRELEKLQLKVIVLHHL